MEVARMEFALRFAVFAIPLTALVCLAPARWSKRNMPLMLSVLAYAGLVFLWQ